MQRDNNLNAASVKEIAADVNMLLDELHGMAEGLFKGAVMASNLNLTGELRESVRSSLKKDLEGFGGEIDIFFNEYWRFKDMKSYNYGGAYMNVDAIKAFVRKIGVRKFAWVPGYENSRATLAEEKAIDRIAWGIIMYRRKMPVVRNNRADRKRLYNKTKIAYLNRIRRRIMGYLGVNVPMSLSRAMVE
jgi:hypothetical protein